MTTSLRALLVIDLQNDFMAQGALPILKNPSDETALVETINRVMDRFDLVLATKDLHPPDHVSFALWPAHCVEGSLGSEFVDGLHDEKFTKVFYKGTDLQIDSYSAFFDEEKRRSTELAQYLRGNEIQTLYICGVALEYCVLYSSLDALEEGFEVFLIEDASAPLDSHKGTRALNELRRKGAKIIQSFEVR